MNRLPRVLQNEIWEYVHGDRPFWKQQFKRTMTELLLFTRGYFGQYPTAVTFPDFIKKPLPVSEYWIINEGPGAHLLVMAGSRDQLLDWWGRRQSHLVDHIERFRTIHEIDHFEDVRARVIRLVQHYSLE